MISLISVFLLHICSRAFRVVQMSACIHSSVRCLNGYELIRKYRCEDCGAVMMCACNEEIGKKHLPHQIKSARELETQRSVPVTDGFVAGVCDECRGLPITPYPRAAIHGQTSKLRRYYWREIHLEEMKRLGVWREQHGNPDKHAPGTIAMSKQLEKEVIEDFKRLHAIAPKYTYSSEKDADVIKKHAVDQIDLEAAYTKDPDGKGAIIIGTDGPCTVEEFVTEYYRSIGYDVMRLESVPFHVLFGVFMWLVIQDSTDPLVRIVGFGDRIAYEQGKESKEIWFHCPEDFGTSGYATRREAAISEHFSTFYAEEEGLNDLFDYWLGPSEKLRQYLWAHRPSDVERARQVLDVIPASKVIEALRYLVANYWGHYLGWPDLLVFRGNEFFLAEVKASGDKLSDEQKSWIAANHQQLRLPFKLVKVRKTGMVQNPTASAA